VGVGRRGRGAEKLGTERREKKRGGEGDSEKKRLRGGQIRTSAEGRRDKEGQCGE